MSWQFWRPRAIGEPGAQIIRRVIAVGANQPPSEALLAPDD